jgi:hypothetical protein
LDRAPRVKKLARSDRTARAWPSWRSARVVTTMICHGQHHQEAEVEQQHQRRLLGLVDGDVHGEQAEGQRDQPTVGPKSIPRVGARPRKDRRDSTCVVVLCHQAAPVSSSGVSWFRRSRRRYDARLPGGCHEHRPRCRAPPATSATSRRAGPARPFTAMFERHRNGSGEVEADRILHIKRFVLPLGLLAAA